MALEIPSTLIREIQLAFRREAGVPSYDPADPALPSLPTIQEAILALDPSIPPHLRCRRCRGGLLRGSDSTICIFCGADRRMEAPPRTISFNSTAGCRKFLESLDLDGSEAVNLDTESNESRKGQAAPKEGLVLSDLLDLELRWPLDKEEIDNSHTNKAPFENSYALNMSGVDLDTYFGDTKNETTSSHLTLSSEQLIPKKQIVDTDNHASDASQNFDFFENLQSSNITVSPANATGAELGYSFAVWDADFQSASSETFAVESKSVDLFQGSSIAEFENPATTAATFSKQTTIEREASIKDKEGQLSSLNNCIQDDLLSQMNIEVVSTTNPFKSIGETNNAELKNDLNSITIVNDSLVQEDQLFTSSTNELSNIKDVDDNDDTLDDWKDFTSSGEAPGGLPNRWAQNFTESSSTKEFNDTKKLDDKDDSHDAWQDFTSSGEAQGGLSNSWTHNGTEATSYVHASGMKSLDLQDMDFGSFIHSDSFSGTLGGQKGSCETNSMQLAPSVSGRTNGTNENCGFDFSIGEDSTAAPNLESSNSNVGKLLSQMHDLSFMLESNLSIPKVDGPGLNP